MRVYLFVYKFTYFFLCICYFLSIQFCTPTYATDTYPQIGEFEYFLFGKTFESVEISKRLLKIEKSIFNKNYLSESLDERAKRIKDYIIGESILIDGNPYEQKETRSNIKNIEYENAQTNEIDESTFVEEVILGLNKQRSFKGLIPLTSDVIANKVANEHANDLILKGHLSYFNLKWQGPDERYTLSGGTGATTEIIKGFQSDNNSNIKLTQLLTHQLIEAIVINSDDSQLAYSPYITHIGFGFALSKDKKAFVSVVEFITKRGEFEPLKPAINFGEKVEISGKVTKPYKFKAISVAYYDGVPDVETSYEINERQIYFDNENIMPYLLPQDHIAYGDTAKNNIGKILKGIGVISAIGAAPFTGGATAVLAPVLLSSIQNGPPREIPLKGGIKSNSNGNLFGEIELNFQGKPGLYFISILAEIPGINYPLVISRRTINVRSPLFPLVKKT